MTSTDLRKTIPPARRPASPGGGDTPAYDRPRERGVSEPSSWLTGVAGALGTLKRELEAGGRVLEEWRVSMARGREALAGAGAPALNDGRRSGKSGEPARGDALVEGKPEAEARASSAGAREELKSESRGLSVSFEADALAMERTGGVLEKALQSSFHNVFSKSFKTEVGSAKDLWDVFCRSLTTSFASALAKMVASWLKSGLEDLFGELLSGLGGFMGSGSSGTASGWGLTNPLQPNLFGETQSGSAVSAFGGAGTSRPGGPGLVIGRTGAGEATWSVPASQASTLAEAPTFRAGPSDGRARSGGGDRVQPVSVAINIENQTGIPVKAEQSYARFDLEKQVIGIVLKSYQEGGSVWQLIRGGKG